MSAVKNEADVGPDVLVEDATFGADEGQGAAGSDGPETSVRDGAGNALNNGETSNSIAEDVEFDDYVQPSRSIGRWSPSSADGSLSIPDDTPSLQVVSYFLSAFSCHANYYRVPSLLLRADKCGDWHMGEAQLRPCGPLINGFKPAFLHHHKALHGPPPLPFSIRIHARRLSTASFSRMSVTLSRIKHPKHPGRSYGGRG